mmetsp:Transcript_56351/g.105643  ORF Transcript_56351/g.105643 Transcript_56351/m.105643 type:complete len:485 (+) Transcript_56351:70-1524(+)
MPATWRSLPRSFSLAPLAIIILSLQGCDVISDVESAVTSGKKQTNSSADTGNGTTSAAPDAAELRSATFRQKNSVPLEAIAWGGGARLLIAVSPAAATGGRLSAQRLVVDTGSSTLAFCQQSLAQEAAYKSTDYISCNQYNPGGDLTGYWGPFVLGEVFAGDVVFPKAAYSIMTEEDNMPCQNGVQGIFGIAFRQLDVAYPADEQPDWSSESGSDASCPKAAGVVPPPMIQKLQSDGGMARLGIYWSGRHGANEGQLYLDEDAVLNEHYQESSVLGPAVLGEVGWYNVMISQITVGDQVFSNFGCSPDDPGQQCIMDTGTPALVVPEEVYNSAIELIQYGEAATITFALPGTSGQDVPLSFDLAALYQRNALSKGGNGVNIILGLPLWAFYYTVFNIEARSVSFVPHAPLSTSTAVPAETEPVAGDPWGPFNGPEPWVPIPSHTPGTWPAPLQPGVDPFGPFGITWEEVAGNGRRMGEARSVHV